MGVLVDRGRAAGSQIPDGRKTSRINYFMRNSRKILGRVLGLMRRGVTIPIVLIIDG